MFCSWLNGKNGLQDLIISKLIESLGIMDQQLPEIIFEDKYLLAINKPAGLLSIRDCYNTFSPYVTKLFEPYYGKLWIVHRLDRDTSGIMILARDRESHRLLNICLLYTSPSPRD